MKIYNKLVLNMDTLEVMEEDSFDYQGPIAECKGSTTTTVDKEYNRRMATIAEQQQAMAQEYFDFWQDEYKPMESAQIRANMELMPQQTRLEKLRMQAEEDLMPMQVEYQKGLMANNLEEIKQGKPVISEYYKQALTGQNPDQKVREARTDVASAFREQEGTLRRQAGRLGLDPNSNRFADAAGIGGLNQARATAGAMTQARDVAEEKNFNRLQQASTLYKSGLPR